MYIHRTLTRHRRTEGLGLNTPSPQQGRENRNPDPDRGITSCAGGRRGREGQGLRQRAPRHPAGSPSLMLRAGRRCSQSRSVHTLQVRVTRRGQGSIARPRLPVALSVVWGAPGPARRPRGEGLGPQSASGLSPPPGLRTTGVAPRPRPAPPRPGSGSPEASAPRPRPKRAVGGGQAFLRRPPPPPAAATKPAAGLHRAPGAASPPGPRRRPGGLR